MDAALLARIGLSRLRLPVPTAKFAVIHAASEALQDPAHGHLLWSALIEWLSELELESEVLEALCIPVLATRAAPVVDVAALQRAIARPSPLSDLCLSEISGRPLLVNSWAKAHSGEVPPLFSADVILEELTGGRLVPGLLASRLRALERRTGYPFLKQWGFEFQRLEDTLGQQSDGHWEYFIEGERGRSVGRFIARRGHLARSAYLRTLALAFDCWEMPEDLTYREAMYATPADFTFLRMLPGTPPRWTKLISDSTPITQDDWQGLIASIVDEVAAHDATPILLYVNTPLPTTATYQAEVEVVSCLHADKEPAPEEVFGVHHFLPEQVELPRTPDWNIHVEPRCPDALFPCNGGGCLLAALVPCAARYVGYLHSDLIQRMPYLPANCSSRMTLVAHPRPGGMDLLLGDEPAGEVRHWNWQWSPTFDKALGPRCGTDLVLSRQCCDELLAPPGTVLSRYWRATVLTREKEYGEWSESVLLGRLA